MRATETVEVGRSGLTRFHFHLAASVGEANGAHLESASLDGVRLQPGGRVVGGGDGAGELFQARGGVRLKNGDQLFYQCRLPAFLQLPESGRQDPRIVKIAAGIAFHCLIKRHIRIRTMWRDTSRAIDSIRAGRMRDNIPFR